jgi:hypothetical protein
MGPILIRHDPDGLLQIPMADTGHETAYRLGILVGQKGPADAAMLHVKVNK